MSRSCEISSAVYRPSASNFFAFTILVSSRPQGRYSQKCIFGNAEDKNFKKMKFYCLILAAISAARSFLVSFDRETSWLRPASGAVVAVIQ